MNGIIDLHHPLMQALGFAVLHSVWQGVLFFCMLKMVLAFVPERNAAARYRILYGSLTALFALFLYTFITEGQHALAALQSRELIPGLLQRPAALSWEHGFLNRYLGSLLQYAPLLALLYTAGLLFLSFRMIRELFRVQQLRQKVILPGNALQLHFGTLKEKAGLGGKVLLRLSEKVRVPVMLGHLKPIILLPISLVSRLDIPQLEAILLHELAHIKRHDYFWNILQMVMETLLFFNPAAWWISTLIREEREHCCDDYVLQQTQTSLPYAHALLALEEYRLTGYPAVMAATGNKKSLLLNRIKRITAMKPTKGNSQRVLASVTVLVLLAVMACFATAFGQEKKEEPKQKTVTKSYAKKVVTITDDNGNTKTYTDEDGDPAAMEEAMKAIPEAMEQAGHAMEKIDWNQVDKTVDMAMAQAGNAMEAINWDEIQNNVDKAMKHIDWDQIQTNVDKAMKDVDWKQINKDMEQARAEVAVAMKEARVQMNQVNREEIRQSMEEVKAEMKKVKAQMKAEMKAAQETSKEQMKNAAEEAGQDKETNVD